MDNDSIQKAGSVKISELKLISSNNTVWDLTEFLIELNIFEDIFSNYLYGNIVLSDSRNLIEHVPIIGEEYLIVKVITPSFTTSIQKTFRIFISCLFSISLAKSKIHSSAYNGIPPL